MEGLIEGLGINLPVLITQVVTFIILLVILRFVAYKPLMRMLDERSHRVKESMDQAEAVKEQSAHAEEEVKKQLEQASREGQDRIARAVKAGEEVKQRAQEDAKKEADVLVERARTEIQRERDDAISGVRREFADLTVLAAGKVIERSLDALKEMRRHEGEGLATDLRKRVQSVRSLLEKIEVHAPLVLEDYRRRLDHRLQNMVKGMDLDPLRLNQEIAFFAERSDISEETVRMTSHLAQLGQMMDSEEPVGRKLEFLLQEVHREVNTVSSKANDQTISQMVVEIKGELEKIREQIQNVA